MIFITGDFGYLYSDWRIFWLFLDLAWLFLEKNNWQHWARSFSSLRKGKWWDGLLVLYKKPVTPNLVTWSQAKPSDSMWTLYYGQTWPVYFKELRLKFVKELPIQTCIRSTISLKLQGNSKYFSVELISKGLFRNLTTPGIEI